MQDMHDLDHQPARALDPDPALSSRTQRVMRLRTAGLSVTRPRLVVLGCLEDHDGHLAVDDIAAALQQAGEDLPRATVYNVVRDLVAAGVAMQADVGPGRALYEVADSWHHHFVCRGCGQVTDVPCQEGRRPCLHADIPGAVIDEAQVIFRGTCARCAAGA